MTSCARRIWGDLKKSLVELSSWLGRRRLTFASSPKPGQWPCGGCHTCWGGADEKASKERLCLSPYVETFNSKVIKGFVPELRSRYVLFVFPVYLCSMYICYEHSMYVSHIRIWLWYIGLFYAKRLGNRVHCLYLYFFVP